MKLSLQLFLLDMTFFRPFSLALFSSISVTTSQSISFGTEYSSTKFSSFLLTETTIVPLTLLYLHVKLFIDSGRYGLITNLPNPGSCGCMPAIFSNEGKYRKPLLNSLLSEMIIRIFRDYEDTLVIPGSDKKTTSHKDWFEILQYTQQNYRSISMQDLAARFNYSERQIQRIFIQTTGSSFRDTVQRQKCFALQTKQLAP